MKKRKISLLAIFICAISVACASNIENSNHESFDKNIHANEEVVSGQQPATDILVEAELSLNTRGSDNIIAAYKRGYFGSELYYLEGDSIWSSYNEGIAISVHGSKVRLIYYQDLSRRKTRYLDQTEFEAFLAFIEKNNINSLSDWDTGHVMDGNAYQYLYCGNGKTHSFYINNPDVDGKEVYQKLVETFFSLTQTGEFEISYDTDDVTVLIPRDEFYVQGVWKNNDDFRVLIKENDDHRYKQPDDLVWRNYSDGKIAEICESPYDKNIWLDYEYSLPSGDYHEHLNNYPWQVTWKQYLVRANRFYDSMTTGLWLISEKEEPILISEETYANPIVIPNTDLVICARAEKGWAHPNDLVLINLNTFEETVLDIAPADDLSPLIYFSGKVLIARHAEGASVYERYSYDVATGTIEQVDQRTFEGVHSIRERFLQSTATPNEYYTVQARNYGAPVVVGKVNIDTLAFTPIARYPGLDFDSMDMWVDEPNQKIYVVINGDLLELPIH